MGLDNRPVLGNSLGGGLWRKTELQQNTAAAAETVEIDSLRLDTFKSAVYVIVVWNDAGDKIKSMMMNLGMKNGQVVESVYNKTGHPLSIALNTIEAAGIISVNLTNNEAFNLNIDITRLATGRP